MDNYFEYAINPGAKVEYSMPYESVRSKISSIQLSAKPINEDVRSPWLTVPAAVSHHVDKFLGPSPYKGRKGIEPCGAKGVYLVEVLDVEMICLRSRILLNGRDCKRRKI